MKGAVFYGIGDLRIEDVHDPQPGPGDVLLRIKAAGICGTDLRIFTKGHHRMPPGTKRILGHELAGEIIYTGGEIPDLEIGMHVGVAPNIGCGTCPQCVAGWTNLCENYRAFGIGLDGAFAEIMLITRDCVQQGNIVRIPEDMPSACAALAEPFSCCLNGQEAVSVRPGDVVLVVGAGPIGLMHVQLAKLMGASKVIVSEIYPERGEQAPLHGADYVFNPGKDNLLEAIPDVSQGRGADVIIIAAPAHQAQEQSVTLAARQGRINFFGGLPKDNPFVKLDSNLIHYKQLIVTGTTGSNVRQYRTTMELITSRRLKAATLIGAQIPLDRIEEGFRRSLQGKELRIIVEP